MRNLDDAANLIESKLGAYTFERTVDISSRKEFIVEIMGERVNILLQKTTLTGSERAKPQIRVITDRALELMHFSLERNERFFCFIYCEHDDTMLKFENIDPRDYIVSLESDWSNAGGRIDVRSIYEYMNENHAIDFRKINKTQHSARSILQATFFKDTIHGFDNFENYLGFFDSRLISNLEIAESIDNPEENGETLNSIGFNKIFFGAPGTGKSYGIQQFIRQNGIPTYSDDISHPNVFRTTLHPEFTYYDFVGQVMPTVKNASSEEDGNRIEYDFVPNIFTKALEHSFSDGIKDVQPVFLILEEMSRANVAAVFGDIFQLLDRSVETGHSEYRINNDLISNYIFGNEQQIYIPGNLFIIGTVNTNDQNVFVMDTAFKRRFQFEYVNANEIAFNEDDEPLNMFSFNLYHESVDIKFNWVTLYRALNKFITTKNENGGLGLKEDKQMGQFFIKFRDGDDSFNLNQIKGKLLQYLFNDIEENSYTAISLFAKEISSFGEVHGKFARSENVFSDEFISVYEELEASDKREGYINV